MARNKRFNGKMLAELRKEANFTQKELGDRLGISRETVGAIEKENPSTMKSLPIDLTQRWYTACGLASTKTKRNYINMLSKYLGLQ